MCSVYCSVQWQHVANAPTNTVAPMRMATVNPVTSFATAAASQPQLTNSMAANPLTTPLPGSVLLNPAGLPVLNPLLSHPDLNSTNVASANAGGLGGMNPTPGGAAASADQTVELATALSRLMLPAGQSLALPPPNLLTSMLAANTASLLAASGVGAWGLAGSYAGMQNFLNAATLQNILSVNSGASLLSPSDQQQLLNAGLSSGLPNQTAVHSSTTQASGVPCTTTVSGATAVNGDHSGATAPSDAGRAGFSSNQSHPTSPPNASQHPPPR